MTQDSTRQGMVSIVIPCFNPGAMLREAVASVDEVRNESVIEVIVVDDGSSEAKTKGILKEAARAAVASSLSRTADRALPGTLGSDWLKANSFCP
jgi:GT2 family glycosyltransferase